MAYHVVPAQAGFFVLELEYDKTDKVIGYCPSPVLAWRIEHAEFATPITTEGVHEEPYILEPDGCVRLQYERLWPTTEHWFADMTKGASHA